MDFEKYLDKALELGSQAVNQHGQQAWEMTLWIVKIDALTSLVPCALFFLIAIIYNIWFWRTNVPKMCADLAEYNKSRHYALTLDVRPRFYFTGIPFFLLTFTGGISLIELLNIWRWVSLFYPELYLAKMALDKVL